MNYIYPNNLKAKPLIWFWSFKDIIVVIILFLLATLILVTLGNLIPGVVAVVYGVMTMRIEDTSIMDFIIQCLNYFILKQQDYIWYKD
jgi:hypothetical protein